MTLVATPLVANCEGRPYVNALGGAPDVGVWAHLSLAEAYA